MPLYKFRAADRSGGAAEVLIEGDTEADALRRVRQRGMTPIASLGLVDNATGASEPLFQKHRFNVYAFTDKLVPLLKAQIPLERALGIVSDGMEEGPGRRVVVELRRGLHEGKRFSALIRSHGALFPPMYANMVEAGEESGSLYQVMAEVQRFINDGKSLREFLIISSIYPAIVFSVTLVVVALLFTVFIPKFSKIFLDMGKELPLPTQIMVWISDAVTGLWWLWLLLAAGLALLVRRVRRGGKAREAWDFYLLKIPLLGPLVRQIEMTRFVRTLSVLIRNHVHLLDTVRIASRVIQNSFVQASLAGVAAELRGGARLSGALSKSDQIPKAVLQMLAIGEETGNMGDMLEQVADQFDAELKSQIKRLLALFEPAVILFLAIIVLCVVLSMFFAIMEMNNL